MPEIDYIADGFEMPHFNKTFLRVVKISIKIWIYNIDLLWKEVQNYQPTQSIQLNYWFGPSNEYKKKRRQEKDSTLYFLIWWWQIWTRCSNSHHGFKFISQVNYLLKTVEHRFLFASKRTTDRTLRNFSLLRYFLSVTVAQTQEKVLWSGNWCFML